MIDPYHVLKIPDLVNVVALTDDQQVLLVDEYRHGVGAVVCGLISGTVEADDQDPGAATTWEWMEETGYKAQQI